MLYAVLAVSSIARGRVTFLDVQAAKHHPGVVDVMTPTHKPPLAQDPDAKLHPFMFRLELLQNDQVRYANQAIATRGHPIEEFLPPALDEANMRAQHQLRIAVKRMRYRLEILEPLFKSGFPELQRTLKEYQEILGKLHDLDVFAELVLERIPAGVGQRSLLQTITARRSRLYGSFVAMIDGFSLDAVAALARSSL